VFLLVLIIIAASVKFDASRTKFDCIS